MQERIRVKLDSRNRVPLTQVLPKVHSDLFHMYKEGERIILEPISEIPTHELWLYKNPTILAEVMLGIEQSLRGETVEMKINFSEFEGNENN